MIFYAVTNGYGDSPVGDVVEFFLRREDAEQFIAECLEDEPSWVDLLSVEAIEFDVHPN